MADWMKVGVDVLVGGAAGAADQLVQNYDENRALKMRAAGTLGPTEKMPMMKQFGTYLDYGVPIVAIAGVGLGFLKGDWATRLCTIGGQLAGRKATHQLSTKSTSQTPSAAYTEWARSQAAAARELAARSYNPEFDKSHVYRVGQL